MKQFMKTGIEIINNPDFNSKDPWYRENLESLVGFLLADKNAPFLKAPK